MRNPLTILLAAAIPCLLGVGLVHADTEFIFTTIAGTAGTVINSAEGTGSAAQFNAPRGVAVDSAGTVYVADSSNHTIRKITPTGVVTTLAGSAGTMGLTDGSGTAARFSVPFDLAVDSAGTPTAALVTLDRQGAPTTGIIALHTQGLRVSLSPVDAPAPTP